MDSAEAVEWPCEAYGPELLAEGIRCFVGGDKGRERQCASQEECSRTVQASRQQIFRRINELSAVGDETFVYLENEFTSPGQLFPAGEDEPPGSSG